MLNQQISQLIAQELNVRDSQILATIQLLDDGNTIPFIARYRKEATGGLDDTQLRHFETRLIYLRELEDRRQTILKSIEEQGKLTDELRDTIQATQSKTELEDLYLPFKPKRRTKGQIAIEAGLEPLADLLWNEPKTSPESTALDYVNAEKGVADVKAALDGARYILMERFAEDAGLLAKVRDYLSKNALLVSKVLEGKEIEGAKFQDYFDHQELLKNVPSHRALAMFRGRNEGILQLSLNADPEAEEGSRQSYCEEIIRDYLGVRFTGQPADKWREQVIAWTWKIKVALHLETELMATLREKAEEEAIDVFARNLTALLMAAPAGAKNTMGLDPGLRTGVKVAVVDNTGKLLATDTIYPHTGQMERAMLSVFQLIKQHNVELIAIGNGTASRETESFVADVIKEASKPVSYLIVSEAGASVYSASKIAIEEFPDLDVTARGAISIARRIQDPMAELVKIDPKSIGVGMYQHDVNQKKLNETLEQTIEHVVNNVGVNINTASWALLSFVSGIKKNVAKNLVDYRHENGDFKDRKELKKVKGLGAKAFEQMAGFVVVPDSENPLDNTIIHPESYHVAETILKEAGCKASDLKDNLKEVRQKLKNVDLKKIISENEFGNETAKDVYEALLKDRRDPRDEFEKPLLRSDILNMDDLQEGMVLEGTVRNVAKFGAFVDIGLKGDALLHISEIAEKFVSDATKELSVGQIIKVKILSLDKERGRVGLTRKGL